jgi:2-oxoglutarate ferredoxin oxidoreductase subunit alpha
VYANISRGGPGVGTIQPSQQDYFQATKAMGSGGHRLKVFAPGSVQEAVDMTYEAFDSADRDRMPVVVLLDGCVGAMMEPVVLPDFKTDFPDKSAWTTLGAAGRPARFISSFNVASTEPYGIEDGNIAVAENYARWLREETLVETHRVEDAELIITAYGITGREAHAVVDELRENGYKAGLIRPRTVSPFPYALFENLPSSVRGILCAEMSIPGQMVDDVKMAVSDLSKVHFVGHSGGILLSAEEIYAEAVQILEKVGEK